MSRLQLHIGGQVDISSREHIPGPFSSNHLGIALHGHHRRLCGAVEHREHRAALVLASQNVDAVIGNELRLLAANDAVVALPRYSA